MKKLLFVAMSSAALLLAACGDDNKNSQETPVEDIQVDLTEAATAYKTDVLTNVTSFVEDVKVLEAAIKEGKLEDATKLYPLVHMNVEKFQPLQSQFKTQLENLNVDVVEGKELEGKGLRAIEFGLYAKKDTKSVEAIAAALVEDATILANDVAKATLDGKLILEDTQTALKNIVDSKLADDQVNLANSQVYDVKATVDAVEQVAKAFETKASTDEVETLKATLVEVNEAIAFYEVGKEDYVAYNIFTNKQKEELKAHLEKLIADFDKFVISIK